MQIASTAPHRTAPHRTVGQSFYTHAFQGRRLVKCTAEILSSLTFALNRDTHKSKVIDTTVLTRESESESDEREHAFSS